MWGQVVKINPIQKKSCGVLYKSMCGCFQHNTIHTLQAETTTQGQKLPKSEEKSEENYNYSSNNLC
jgi:hypothetical protein